MGLSLLPLLLFSEWRRYLWCSASVCVRLCVRPATTACHSAALVSAVYPVLPCSVFLWLTVKNTFLIQNVLLLFKVIQGHWFWHQLKAVVCNSNLGPVLHHLWDMANYWQKMPIFPPHSYSTASFTPGELLRISGRTFIPRSRVLAEDDDFLILACFVLTQCLHVTDRQTDSWTIWQWLIQGWCFVKMKKPPPDGARLLNVSVLKNPTCQHCYPNAIPNPKPKLISWNKLCRCSGVNLVPRPTLWFSGLRLRRSIEHWYAGFSGMHTQGCYCAMHCSRSSVCLSVCLWSWCTVGICVGLVQK